MDWTVVATWVPIIISLVGLLSAFISWRKSEQRHRESEQRHRETELRREDVFAWSNECIEVMQSLFLMTLLRKGKEYRFSSEEKFNEIIFKSSILIERGRLLFKNEEDPHGAEKELAYRGLRPRILDQLLIAHQIALNWHVSDAEQRLKLCLLAEKCVKRFVSFAQQEVGRERAACVAALEGGNGVVLSELLSDSNVSVDYQKLQKSYFPK